MKPATSVPFHRIIKRNARFYVGPALPKPDTGGLYIQAAKTGEIMVWKAWVPRKAMRVQPDRIFAELPTYL